MSLIPKFLTADGRKEVARADKEARALESQLGTDRQSLPGKQARRLERRLVEMKEITRRDLLEKWVYGLGATGMVAAATSFLMREEEKEEATGSNKNPAGQEFSNTTATHEVSEEELQHIIERIEIGVGEWERIIREKIEKNGGLPHYLRENDFWEPFGMISLNAENKLKNARVLLRQMAESGDTQLEDVRYFSYDTLDNFSQFSTNIRITNMKAFFVPLRRRIYLNPKIDPGNPSEFLTICHEIRHAAQDTYMRSTMSRDTYFSQIERKPNESERLDIRLELDAYSYEIELADILLDGKLRDDTIKTDEIFQKFKANGPKEMGSLEILHDFAKLYFPLGKSTGHYPPAFYNEIVQIHANQGYEICLPNEKGELEPIQGIQKNTLPLSR